MKIEDYEKLSSSLTAENAPSVMQDMMKSIREDLTERDALAEKVASLDSKNRELQDTNIKLFLSQTSKVEPNDDSDKSFDDIVADMKSRMEE